MNALGRKAIAKTAWPREVQGVGKVIAYCDAPTVTILKENGSYMTWRADLCEFSDWTQDDEIAFLRAEVERLRRKCGTEITTL